LGINHTTVWETVQKLAEAIYQPKLLAVKKHRNLIAVDETGIKINGEKRYLWAAIDVESRKFWQSGLQQPGTGGLPGISFWLF